MCLLQQLGDLDDGSSPQLGWAADGFPVYGPRGPGGALMKRCGEDGAHATYCVDACGGYYGGGWSDDFLYRYFLMGEDAVVLSNPLSPTPSEDFFPHAPFCLLGCGSVYVDGADRNPTIGSELPACGGDASAGTAEGYAAAALAGTTDAFAPYALDGGGGGGDDAGDDNDESTDRFPDWAPACAESCESCEDFAASDCGSPCTEEEAASMTQNCAAEMDDDDDDDDDDDIFNIEKICNSEYLALYQCSEDNCADGAMDDDDDGDDDDDDFTFPGCAAYGASADVVNMCTSADESCPRCAGEMRAAVECVTSALATALSGDTCGVTCPAYVQHVVEGDLTVAGMSLVDAEANKGVFKAAIATSFGVEEDTVTVTVAAGARRRRLDEATSSVVVSYVIEVDSEADAVALVDDIGAVDEADVDSAIATAATDAGVATTFAAVETTAIATPEATTTEGYVDGAAARAAPVALAAAAGALLLLLQ